MIVKLKFIIKKVSYCIYLILKMQDLKYNPFYFNKSKYSNSYSPNYRVILTDKF